jgi:hypothetical protein
LDYGTGGGVQKVKDQWTLFDTKFEVKAESIGYSLKITWETPNVLDVLDWDGRVRILRKADEWPQSWDDPEATLISDEVTTTPTVNEIIESSLAPGKIFYYTLFMQRTDSYWVEDPLNNRRSAYAYGRWGSADYMFGSLPNGWQIDDNLADGELYAFMSIFGALTDNQKTDAENLLTLFSADTIHADLLWMIDAKLNWPTWLSIGAIQRRKETLRAVDNYKLFGTASGYESLLQEASLWDATVYEGWRYVMFSNGKYGCTTPDTTDPNIGANRGLVTDLLKYTNASNEWHSVSGLAFEMVDVAGVSAELTDSIVKRWFQLIDFSRASYVNYGLIVFPHLDEESVLYPTDDWSLADDLFVYPELVLYPIEEDLGYTAPLITLMVSNDLGAVTNDEDARTFHEAMSY